MPQRTTEFESMYTIHNLYFSLNKLYNNKLLLVYNLNTPHAHLFRYKDIDRVSCLILCIRAALAGL